MIHSRQDSFFKIIGKLEGTIDDKLEFCGVPELSDKHEKICAEILKLAKERKSDLQGETG